MPALSTAAFVPVRLVDLPAVAQPIEVVLRSGRLLRVTTGFSVATLRDLVTVLEDLPC